MQPLLSRGLAVALLLCACLPGAEGQDPGPRLTLSPACTSSCSSRATGAGDVSRSVEVPEQRPPVAKLQQSGSSRLQAQVVRQERVPREHSAFGFCFREVKDGQCASPLLGLRTQEMCCRGIGRAWGTSDCVLCPQSGQNSSCPSGFHQVNGSACVDVNECVKPGLCENGLCVNTRGSYSCVCRPGFILDASHGLCISRSVISEEKGQCYRVLSPDLGRLCSLPILRNITRQICCCSRVGKAWGPTCQRCPSFGSEAFKQSCPAGPGYQYSTLQFRSGPLREHLSPATAGSVFPRGFGWAAPPEVGSTARSKVSPSVDPPVATSRTNGQQKQRVLHSPPEWRRQDPQQSPGARLAPRSRPAPSLDPQKRPDPQTRLAPSLAPRSRPAPSLDPQKRPDPQTRLAPSLAPHKRPAPTPIPRSGSGPERLPTVTPRVEGPSVCEDRPGLCGPGRCVERPRGGHTCVCDQGYEPNLHMTFCHDRDECLQNPCGHAHCTNTPGSFRCICRHGYRVHNASCADIDECLDQLRCPGQECLNSPGSYRCVSCQRGFHLSGRRCTDVDECEDVGSCPGGECVNTPGSYRCLDCGPGYQRVSGVCADIDECLLSQRCFPSGECVNVAGSYRCVCADGFTASADSSACLDVDECAPSVGGATCPSGACVNTLGSYRCITSCPPGSRRSSSGECTAAAAAAGLEPRPSTTPPSEPLPSPGPGEGRECYYNLAERGTCNLLATNTTQQECCCTVGQGWGLGCQYQACPPPRSAPFQALCPSGRGYVTSSSDAFSYTDVDECKRFQPEVCKSGMCVNNIPGYKCYCSSGYVYDSTLLECIDHDECEEEACVGGTCVNTVGSYYCSCPPPLTLDDTQRACLNASHLSADEGVSLCWQHVTDLVCQSPLLSGQVSFADCCCLYGAGWGMECALCPAADSDEFAALCSPRLFPSPPEPLARPDASPGARRGARLRGRAFGGRWSDDGFSGLPRADFRSYPDGDLGAGPPRPPSFYLPADPGAERPFAALPPPLLSEDDAEVRSPFYDGRAGAQRRAHHRQQEASAGGDCGILFGCENGRCVRVAEGYTCDCDFGYQLDLTFMTCTDVNECEDVAGVDFPCVNARCVNTEGSFRCVCRRGYVMSHRPNHCVAA
ncbi:latent-transforming growth factor beta-binding protein 4-like isoform X3 [Synchiropus splendidus]|uniref:latent-transforming growth factor beta-binding protein 4-like isoform X3 n=1 Tax=Synchiropus splendidus TaxID=270530 RepID=UPI00237D9F70|nr:latent-transforming growth factor beta-binding protein 4-like isoform X3 [Synchiropus splendidus]